MNPKNPVATPMPQPTIPSKAKAKSALRLQEKEKKQPVPDLLSVFFLALFFSLWLCSSKLLEHRGRGVDLQAVKRFLIIAASRHFTYECTRSDAQYR